MDFWFCLFVCFEHIGFEMSTEHPKDVEVTVGYTGLEGRETSCQKYKSKPCAKKKYRSMSVGCEQQEKNKSLRIQPWVFHHLKQNKKAKKVD